MVNRNNKKSNDTKKEKSKLVFNETKKGPERLKLKENDNISNYNINIHKSDIKKTSHNHNSLLDTSELETNINEEKKIEFKINDLVW